jgi:hypothetical protein
MFSTANLATLRRAHRPVLVEVGTYLHAVGAAGVPLYVSYHTDGTDEVWPQVLNSDAITERLNRA